MSNGVVPHELIVDALADAGLVPIRHQNLPDGRTKMRVIRVAIWIPLEEVRKRKSAESAHAAAELQDAETSGRSSTSSVSS